MGKRYRLFRKLGRLCCGLGLMKIGMIEIIEGRNMPVDILPENLRKDLPETGLVIFGTVVFSDILDPLPHGGNKGFSRISVAGDRLYKQTEIGPCKLVVIHGQKGSVHIE